MRLRVRLIIRSGPLRVSIASGWSAQGGSTHHFIALTNRLNERGIPTRFYGPHNYHLDKCQSDHIQKIRLDQPDDVLIGHFLDLNEAVKELSKVVLNCHESPGLFSLEGKDLSIYEEVVYVSERQREAQGISHPNRIIPPCVNLVAKARSPRRRGQVGVIGSIDRNKQVHVAVESALENEPKDTKVLIIGKTSQKEYFSEKIKPLLSNKRVKILPPYDDKNQMYDMVDAVYSASKSETYGLVLAETKMLGIPYHDLNGASEGNEYWTEEEKIDAWKTLLEL